MRIVLWLIVLVGVGWTIVYFAGGYDTFDPSDQCKKPKASIFPGMAYKRVFDITGEPKKWQVVQRKTTRSGDQELEFFEPGPPMPFTRDNFEWRLADGSISHGFQFNVIYSDSVAFTVAFDGYGEVVEAQNSQTLAGFLQMGE